MRIDFKVIFEPDDRVRVVEAPPGEENAWLLGKEGTVVQIKNSYIQVKTDGKPRRTVLLSPGELEYIGEGVPTDPLTKVCELLERIMSKVYSAKFNRQYAAEAYTLVAKIRRRKGAKRAS